MKGADTAMPGIRIDGVTKAYKNGPLAVDDVSLEVRPGEFMVLVGPSGCGKSTLLKLVAGIEETTSGSIHIGDRDVTQLDPRKRDIAMVFQNYALYPHLSVRANLGFGLKLRKTAKRDIAARVDDVARILGLEEMMERKPGELSGGQRQRVAMGRAIVREPRAFLMDEPLSNLDAKLRVSMRAQLSRLHERLGVTTVYVTHDQIEAMTLGQRVAVLRGGVLQQCDTPEMLFEHPANLFVAAFIGSPAMNLVEAVVEDGEARFGSCRVPLAPGSRLRGRIVLGLRPHDVKLGIDTAPTRPISGRVQVVERLGTETHVVVGVDAPRLRSRVLSEAVDAGPDDDVLLAEDDRASFTVVTEARAEVAVGDTIELAVDAARLHGFDIETGLALGAPAAAAPAEAREALTG
jgi:multiple sugar transport system ATP-binding protein